MPPASYYCSISACMTGFADIHCHIIPYVDDGAVDKDTSDELLDRQIRQGAGVICCTPHLRCGMFETPDEKVIEQFSRLKKRAAGRGVNAELFLSREYHADRLLAKHLKEGSILPLGPGHLLLEMSSVSSESDMVEYIKLVQAYGLIPLMAHPERYRAIRQQEEIADRLVSLGAKLQINISSLLGREGIGQKRLCRRLLKRGTVYAVASDAHDLENRPPELDRAYSWLARKLGEKQAEMLMITNPLKILKE